MSPPLTEHDPHQRIFAAVAVAVASVAFVVVMMMVFAVTRAILDLF
jgi:hypothetical protein